MDKRDQRTITGQLTAGWLEQKLTLSQGIEVTVFSSPIYSHPHPALGSCVCACVCVLVCTRVQYMHMP